MALVKKGGLDVTKPAVKFDFSYALLGGLLHSLFCCREDEKKAGTVEDKKDHIHAMFKSLSVFSACFFAQY